MVTNFLQVQSLVVNTQEYEVSTVFTCCPSRFPQGYKLRDNVSFSHCPPGNKNGLATGIVKQKALNIIVLKQLAV